MKNKILKKKIFFSLASLAFVGALSSSIGVNINNQINKSQTINKESSKLENAKANSEQLLENKSTTTNLIPWNQTNDGKINLNTPRQYITFDNLNTSYAILNSSTSTQAVASSSSPSSSKFDNLTKFDMGTGTAKWNKKVSELSTNNKTTTISSGSYLAIAFLQNYLSQRESMVLAIVKDDTNSKDYLVALKWSDGTVISMNEISNSTQVASKSENQSNKQYFINVNNFISLNISISCISIPSAKTTYLDGTNNNISYSSFNITDKNLINKDGNKTIQLKTQNIPSDITSKFLATNSKITDFYTDSNYMYYVFQQDSFAKTGAINNFVTLFRVGKNQDISSISASNFMSLSLTQDDSKIFQTSKKEEKNGNNEDNTPLVTHVSVGNDNYLLISQKKESTKKEEEQTQQNTYLVAKYNSNDFQNSTNISFKQLSMKDNGFILSLNPLYSSTSKNDVVGFIGLSSDNKSIYFSNDFSSAQLYYNFESLPVASKQLSTGNSSNKKIYTTFTEPNDANWYAQMTDGSIIQFSGSNLIGQLDQIVGQQRTEILANISFKQESEIPPEIIYYDTTASNFNTFISDNAKSFLHIKSSDPVFGDPIITATVQTKNSTKGKNSDITIAFYQKLRKRESNGTIQDSGQNVLLGYKDYTFINENLDIKVKDKSQISSSITSKYPSKVTEEEVKQILNISNGTNYDISLQPNDAFGTLTVNLTFPYAWIAGQLKVNYKESVTIGNGTNPYFMVDLLNGLDASVKLVTEEFLNKDENKDLKTVLSIKYGTMFASEIKKENVLSDFVLLGDAFNDMQLINQNLIEKPTVNNIQVIPVDTEGYLYITVTIPKIGTNQNVTYSFKSASIFMKSATSDQNAYIIFRDADEVRKTSINVGNDGKTEQLGSYTPSKIASQINTDKTWLLYFANISYYVLNMIYSQKDSQNPDAKLNIITNDGLGQIKISIEFTNAVPGLDGKSFSKTFDGFAKQGSSGAPSDQGSYPTFHWGTIDNNEFNGKTPFDITVNDIEKISGRLFVLNGNATSLKKKISVSPLDASGAVLVTVTFYNWWEKQKQSDSAQEQPVLLPEKTFQTILTNGLRSTKAPVNVIVWKSFDELDSNLKNSTATNALVTIDSSTSNDLEKLEKVANLSDTLKTQLQNPSSNLSLSITSNNSLGYIEVYAKFTLDGKTLSYGTKISGFNLESSNYVVTLASDTSQAVNDLKKYLPSQLTDEQIGSLVNVQLGNNFSRKITTKYNDINGTLYVKVELLKTNQDGTTSSVIPSIQRTYYGFKTNVPQYKGTNYLIIGLSIAIPIVLLLSPILFIVFYKNRKDVKRFASVLDKRLSETESRKKHTDVNTIEDLLSIEKD